MESVIRLGVFVTVLVVMVLWEYWRPKRQPRYQRRQRWPANLGIVLVDTLITRLLVPTGLVGVALFCQQQGWGLWNVLDVPYVLAVVASVLLLDIVIYWQHRAFHRIPWLWRLHRVHHADPDFDVTTGLRFHPFEILLSLLIKATAVALLGVPVVAVIIFEVLLNACSLFNHGNVALPTRWEQRVRKVLITQELHRIHHSSLPVETNSNYGFSVSWWDHLFGSYTDQASAGSDKVDIGLTDYRDARLTNRLWGLLKIPFRSNSGR